MKGKKVLVTGASTGIGACIAELFSSYGAIIGIHYRQSEEEIRPKEIFDKFLELAKEDTATFFSYKETI